jgi:hypothetical protein
MYRYALAAFVTLASFAAYAVTYTQVLWGFTTGASSPLSVHVGGVWYAFAPTCAAGQAYAAASAQGTLTCVAISAGTVTSVGLSLPAIFSVSGSPVTTAGTLTGALATQSAHTAFAGPTGGAAAAPTFRALTAADVQGTSTNDSAAAGYIGEYVSSTVLVAGEITLTTATAANVTSVSLTAGDWDCSGIVIYDTAATTVVTAQYAWISTSSATLPTAPNSGGENGWNIPAGFTGYSTTMTIAPMRVSLAATTTVYLSAYAAFTTSTEKAYGFVGCRRMR